MKTTKQPVDPVHRAWVQGVIDTTHAVLSGMAGKSDGKVYHRYELGSAEELHWHYACQWTSERMMQHAMMREELRKPDPADN